MNNSCKIWSECGTKGGESKTTFTWTLASYLTVYEHKNVLLIDMDFQSNLTSLFNLTPDQIQKHTIVNAFKHDSKNPKKPFNFKPFKINKYLSILPATPELARTDDIMKTNQKMAIFVLLHYLVSIKATKTYDYILIDNHNSLELNAQNALLCSDYALVPVTPSKFSLDGIGLVLKLFKQLKDSFVDPITNQSKIHCKMRFIGAIVDYNSKASREFVGAIKNNPLFLCYFHRRILFDYANLHKTTIFQEAKNRPNDQKAMRTEIIPNIKKIISSLK